METQQGSSNEPKQKHGKMKVLLVSLCCMLMAVGQIAGPLLCRMYFLHGGKRKWLTSWLLTAGFPVMILPISLSYMSSRAKTDQSFITRWLFWACAILGFLLGFNSYLYSFGISYLPLSVYSLLSSTQLAFTAVFAFVVVKHKFTHFSINAVILMTFGSILLGFHMNGDRPKGESSGEYILGFFMVIGAAALHGFLLTAMEYTQKKAAISFTFDIFLQFQLLLSIFATLFCSVAMIINKDFQAIPKEAREFGLGETKYYAILVLAAIANQFSIIGSVGMIFCCSSLLAGLVTCLLVPVLQVFCVIFLREGFSGEKGMALAMCLWGFASYLYGEHQANNNKKPAAFNEEEINDDSV
ncbi:hypothetical protein Tsubulata_012478 [Turnera subulata]|uniref:Probable purine permease n=1 Tax=Turnera subulata TaxID=218843 RepID=A0A9Q0GN26_9ROSI|nr:hypothetical protein Tsubulata_012478 [Turnera subulata]